MVNDLCNCNSIRFIDSFQLALEVIGIFRVSPSSVKLTKFKSEYDRGLSVNFPPDINPHIVSGLLKLYLRELPEPVIPYSMYDRFVDFELGEIPEQIDTLTELVQQLPKDNFNVLHYLAEFQARVIAHSDVNLMTIENLAVVFGPNLLRTENTLQNSQRLVKDSPIVAKIMETIVLQRESIFKGSKIQKVTRTTSQDKREAYSSSRKFNSSTPEIPETVKDDIVVEPSKPLEDKRKAWARRPTPARPNIAGASWETINTRNTTTLLSRARTRPGGNLSEPDSSLTTENVEVDSHELPPSPSEDAITIKRLMELLKAERAARRKLEERVAILEELAKK